MRIRRVLFASGRPKPRAEAPSHLTTPCFSLAPATKQARSERSWNPLVRSALRVPASGAGHVPARHRQ